MILTFQNKTGMKIQVTDGFSWTTLLFGPLVPLFRGDGKWFFIMLISGLLTYGISSFVFPFFYNEVYIKALLEKGFYATDKTTAQWLRNNNLIV